MVPGGGVALIRALSAISGLKGANEDQNHGITIALRAMESPMREIVTNCGEEPSVVLNNVKQGTQHELALPGALGHLGQGTFLTFVLGQVPAVCTIAPWPRSDNTVPSARQ